MAKKAIEEVKEVVAEPIHTDIVKLTIDYPNEGLNDIGRKINELIDRVNAL